MIGKPIDLASYVDKLNRRSVDMTREIFEKGCSGHVFSEKITAENNTLNNIYIYLTFDCPLRCYFCFAKGGRRKTDEMTPAEFAKVTQDAIDAGFKKVIISGGEPFSYKHFKELLLLYEKMNFGNTVLALRSSFGFPIDSSLMDLVCRVFDKITISIDGNEENHDKIRGKGVYKQAIENIREALNRDNCEIGIAAVLSREQKDGIEGKNVLDLYDSLNLDYLSIRPIKALGEMEGKQTETSYYTRYERNCYNLPEFMQNCGLGHLLYVEPDGTVFPCYAVCKHCDRLGNLKTDTLNEIITSDKFLALANHGVDDDPVCRNCEVRYYCGGVCKAAGPVEKDCKYREALLAKIREQLEDNK